MRSVFGKSGPLVVVLTGLCVLALSPRVGAENDPSVLKGVQYLRGKSTSTGLGETALIALAMLKAEVSPDDPALAACIARLRGRITAGKFMPEQQLGPDIYEAAVVALALGNIPNDTHKSDLEAIARYLLAQEKANGSWDYTSRTNGDTSISQYAVLGLWECENGGVRVPPEVWERAANWFMSTQASGGSWTYHRDEVGARAETLSMTAAGVGSLLICQRQLDRYRKKAEAATTSSLLVPLTPEPARLMRFDVTLSNAKLDAAIKRGLTWLAANFTTTDKTVIGQTPYYGLYGIERTGALADRETLGKVDWFEQGRQFIMGSQQADGSWTSQYGEVPNTAWAILFLTKSTAKTLLKIGIKPLGAGTLLGGRGLPKDLSSLTVAGGRVVSRPMNGAVEGMLAAMEDPRVKQADSALSGLVARYRAEGPGVLRPLKDRFRKMLRDQDPGLRRVAVWSLARTADLDVVPLLIEALNDPDESVVVVAREGLQLLSRKIAGYGPPTPSTPPQRREAAGRWRAWYDTVRPLGVEGRDDEATAARGSR